MNKHITIIGLMLLAASFSIEAATNGTVYPVPPVEHPRLYIRSHEIPELKARMAHPEGQAILKRMETLAKPRTEAEELADTELRAGIYRHRNSGYYTKMRGLPMQCELLALDYLVNRNPASADKAITSFLDTLKKVNFRQRYDMSRATGTMIMAASLIYDWCYDRMPMSMKRQYIDEIIRIAGTMECGYPPTAKECITGHGSEYMILRDMLSASIAIYDEHPDMYNKIVPLIYDSYVPVRNFFFKGKNYHQGSSYVGARFLNDIMSQWILTKMGAPSPYVPDMQYVLYDLIYRQRPDDFMMPAGDTRPRPSFSCATVALFAYSYYHDPYLKRYYEVNPLVARGPEIMLELLWKDFDIKSKRPDDLPLIKYSGTPFGWTLARTGWDENSVIAEMKINEHHFGNHQHLDGGAFQIYYRGPLAIDSGNYHGAGGQYNSPHVKTWHKRTIAHNSLLIYDPDEVFLSWNYGGEDKTTYVNNEGGQRLPGILWGDCNSFEQLLGEPNTVGKILSHKETEDWAVLKGDITKAYSAKVKDVRRSFAFINTNKDDVKALLFVYDHIVAAKAEFKKFFLLHSIEEPQLTGNRYTVKRTWSGEKGMLWCNALLPESASVAKIGGPEKEFWVFGSNYPNDYNDPANEMGAWRVEVCPPAPQTEDVFLNVIQVGDNDCTAFKDAQRISGAGLEGACACGNAVIFNKEGGLFKSSFEFTTTEAASVLVTDLEAGEWKVFVPGRKKAMKVQIKEGENCVRLEGKAGLWKFHSQF